MLGYFDLESFLETNYVSIRSLLDTSLWSSYCANTTPQRWWWHLQENISTIPCNNSIIGSPEHYDTNNLAIQFFRIRNCASYVNFHFSKYMFFRKIIMDDYTNSFLRIPLGIIGNVNSSNVLGTFIDSIQDTTHIPDITQIENNLPTVILDGYLAWAKDEMNNSSEIEYPPFGTNTKTYYPDTTNTTEVQNHIKMYFRFIIHSRTWYIIIRDTVSSNMAKKMFRIKQNSNPNIILGNSLHVSVALDIHISTESITNNGNTSHVIYANLFPSVYLCIPENTIEYINTNIEWKSVRYWKRHYANSILIDSDTHESSGSYTEQA